MPKPSRRPLVFGLVSAVLLACASEPRPWKVTPSNERLYHQSHDACTKLTDDPDAYEKCMERRGLRREWIFGL